MSTRTTGYCDPADLLTGDMPFPMWLTREQAVVAAADEIDSHLGHYYEIPLVLTSPDGTPAEEQIPPVVPLTMKRINAALASGRAILQMASPTEQVQLHAYGASLVKEAIEAIEAICDGRMALTNVPLLPGETVESSRPLIYNVDPESNVEAFYDRIVNPAYNPWPGMPSGDVTYLPGGMVRW